MMKDARHRSVHTLELPLRKNRDHHDVTAQLHHDGVAITANGISSLILGKAVFVRRR